MVSLSVLRSSSKRPFKFCKEISFRWHNSLQGNFLAKSPIECLQGSFLALMACLVTGIFPGKGLVLSLWGDFLALMA